MPNITEVSDPNYWLTATVIAVFLFLLISVIFALIFNASFRRDIVAAKGEAIFLGLSTKGTAILSLCVLFIGNCKE